MSRTRTATCALALVLALPAAVQAQTPAPATDLRPLLAPRTRVWVESNSEAFDPCLGTVATVTRDSVTVIEDATQQTRSIPINAIDRMRWPTGQKSHGIMGFVVGAGVGALFGNATTARGNDFLLHSKDVGSVGGALVGGVIGYLIGAHTLTDTWSPVTTSPPEPQRRP